MSFFRQYGKLASGSVTLTSGTLTSAIITPAADEFVDVYNITVASNDSALNQITITDGTNTLAVIVVNPSQSTVPFLTSVPIRGKRGGAITATAAAITAAKSVFVSVSGLQSKT